MNLNSEESFDEIKFIVSLVNRPEACRIASQNFNPEFLHNEKLIPILHEIFNFVKLHKISPSLATLHDIFKNKNNVLYENVYKGILTKLQEVQIDSTSMTYVLDKAKNVAMSRSLISLFESSQFREMNENFDGEAQLKEIERWIRKFNLNSEDIVLNLKEAYSKLIEDRFNQNIETVKIPTWIDFVDEWTDGGMRTKNLGIFVAPTGEGKSLYLMDLAYRIAKMENRKVLFITNELSINEQTERFISCIARKHIKEVVEDPTIVAQELERHWGELQKNLIICETSGGTANNVEAILSKEYNLTGIKPECVVIDYMERMQPIQTGFDPTATWSRYGAIAKDLCALAKKWDVLLWTAAQTNRSGMKNSKNESDEVSLYLSSLQGSVQHAQEAALVIGWAKINKYPGIKTTGATLVKVQCLKNRHGKNEGQQKYVEVNFPQMHITNKYHNEIKLEESEQPPKKMNIKDIIREESAKRLAEAIQGFKEDEWNNVPGPGQNKDTN